MHILIGILQRTSCFSLCECFWQKWIQLSFWNGSSTFLLKYLYIQMLAEFLTQLCDGQCLSEWTAFAHPKRKHICVFFWVFLLKINGVERNTSAFSNETSTFTLFCLNLVLNLTQTPDSPKKSALFSIYFRFFTICTETSQLANKLRNGLTFQRAHHRSCVLFLLHWHRVRLQPAQRLVDVWLLL